MKDYTFLGSLLGDLKSHPNKKLSVHLENVAEISCLLADKYHVDINRELLNDIGWTHDLGKVDLRFQKYLDGEGNGVNHSQRSAWFTYSLNEDIWATEAVCRHHTHLFGTNELYSKWYPDDGNVTWENISKDMKQLIPNWPYLLDKKQFEKFETDIFSINEEIQEDDWFKLRTLYSLFITADRMDALGISKEDILSADSEIQLNPNFEKKKKHSLNEAVDNWRSEVQNICYEQASKITGPGVYTLTLPTGAGKTIAGFEIATLLSKRFETTGIIYALPFISIVEQTSNIAKSIFGEDAIQEDHSLIFSENKFGQSENNNDEIEVEQNQTEEIKSETERPNYSQNQQWSRMFELFRYWQKPIIITTLVHFWQVLFSSKANKTMNFHRLSNAIVIIDEPQGIAPEFWQELGEMFAYISEKYQTFFILMTATQPFFPSLSENNELAPPNTTFPKNRHNYKYLSDKYDLDNLITLLSDENIPFEKSGAIVLNTKASALNAYHQLTNVVSDDEIYFLSGWLTPKSKKRVLNKLKSAEQNRERRYLVTTQVVEAGVDLDFSWIFRDFAPLDSLIQVAGRCNRHGVEESGTVLIAELQAKNKRGYCSYVYSSTLLDSTRKFLNDKFPVGVFNELNIHNSISDYYQEIILNRKITPKPLLTSLKKGDWENLPPLIEDKGVQVVLYVEEDECFMPILNSLLDGEWNLENRQEQKKLLGQLQQYAISIPLHTLKECLGVMSRFEFCGSNDPLYPIFGAETDWVLTKDAIGVEGEFYNRKLGFIPPKKETDDFIF